MFRWIYDSLLLLLGLVALPKLLLGRRRANIRQRLGMDFPKVIKGEGPIIWVHAVSVGEVKAVARLSQRLKREKGGTLIISTVTETGHAEAKRSIPNADHYVYLPIDFSWIIRPIIRRVKPELVILCESDFWFNFLYSAKEVGARVVLVNGKMSERSLKRYKWFSFFTRRLFSMIDLFCLQAKPYAKRFEELGIPKDKIVVTGNLKLEGDNPKMSGQEAEAFQKKLGIKAGDLTLVIGSSHAPEEEELLNILEPLWADFPQLKVILVPRHPERFDTVAEILEKRKIPFSRYSEKGDAVGRVVLIDAMGVLRQCYQIADIALVAGSYTPKVGGHNILEPCSDGVPVIYGPEMSSQPDLVRIIQEYKAGQQVSLSELKQVLHQWLSTPELRKKIGAQGLRLTHEIQGATEATLKALEQKERS